MFAPKMYTEEQCSRVLTNLFGPEITYYTGYQYQLTIIYTDGKEISWSNFPSTKDAKGIMTGAFLIPKSHIAAGGALIDLRACYNSASSGKTSIRIGIGSQPAKISTHKSSLADLRYQVIFNLAHEIFHMIQSWKAGNVYDGNELITPASLRYTETFKRLSDQLARNNPGQSTAYIKAAAHARHPSEQEAEQFAHGRIQRFRKVIENGGWDECMPIDILKSYIH